jgi:3-oxoacyl-[acyl-carrier-protein] synthase-3
MGMALVRPGLVMLSGKNNISEMNYKIKATEYYLPERIIDNKYLHEMAGIDIDFLENKVGIKQRHIAADDESTSDMATKAAMMLIERNNLNTDFIDLLILCTQNPDYKLPATACIVQNNLQLKTSSIAFDINLGCSGFIYSLVIAGNFLKTRLAKWGMIIMADQYSKIIDYKDKNTASLFGDAASASLVEPCADSEGVIDTIFGTDGSNADKLIVYNSGVALNPEKNKFLYMDGREIFKFSVQVVPTSVNEILKKNNLKIANIRYFIFHQANKYMLNEIQKRLNISDSQMVIDLEYYGNTVSSTIPIAYKNILVQKTLRKNDLIIFCGFGVGLSWGTILYRF